MTTRTTCKITARLWIRAAVLAILICPQPAWAVSGNAESSGQPAKSEMRARRTVKKFYQKTHEGFQFEGENPDLVRAKFIDKSTLVLRDKEFGDTAYDGDKNRWIHEDLMPKEECRTPIKIGPDQLTAYAGAANLMVDGCERQIVILTNRSYGIMLSAGCDEPSRTQLHLARDSFKLLGGVQAIPADCNVPKAKSDGPSFACGQANSESEKVICDVASLSKADWTMNELYAAKLKRVSSDEAQATRLRNSQREWIRQRDQRCIGLVEVISCLEKEYKNRIADLQNL